MSAKQKDLHILLGIVFFCVGITLFHVRGITAQNKYSEQTKTQIRPIESLNAQDALDYVMPLLISGNISGAATLLTQSNPVIRKQIIDLLLEQQKTSLSSYNKLIFLIATAHAYAPDRAIQNELFDIIEENKESLPYTHTLLYATQDVYQDVLEPLLAWIANKKTTSFAESLLVEGIKTIISANKVEALDTLLSKKIRLTSAQATSLLHMAVMQQSNPRFVPLLASAGANVNAADNTSRTLLMHAVELNNVDIARALLEAGANPNSIISPLVGSALQLAVEKHHVKIELLLRQYGGKE